MGGLFNRVHIWVFEEVLKSAELNAEFDNIINNLVPLKIDTYSTNVAQMQIETNPGGLGTENLATNLAGEIERIRFVLARIIGLPLWYQSPSVSLNDINGILQSAFGVPPTRVVSGALNPSSNQPGFLKASGTLPSITLLASPTVPFVVFIDGTQYSFTSNIVLGSLAVAPSVNNTALINSALATGQEWTKLEGEDNSLIPIDTAGVEITNRTGQTIALKNPNTGNEIFISNVDSSTILSKAFRGYFFDSSFGPIPRDVLNDNDSLSILRLTWVFLTKDGALSVSYANPTYSGTAPLSPAIGDFWFDQSVGMWKQFTGTGFVQANAVFIGYAVQDTTKTIAARSVDFFNAYSEDLDVYIKPISTTEVKSTFNDSYASVYGHRFAWNKSEIIWDYTTDLDSGVSSSLTKTYYFYLTDGGARKISDIAPHNRLKDLRGWYHPFKPWRAIGAIFRDGAGNFDFNQIISYAAMKDSDSVGDLISNFKPYDINNPKPGYVAVRNDLFSTVRRELFFRLYSEIGFAAGNGDGTDTFTLPLMNGTFPRFMDPTGLFDLDFASRSAQAAGGNSGGDVGSYEGDTATSHHHEYLLGNLANQVSQTFDVSNATVGYSAVATTGGGNGINLISAASADNTKITGNYYTGVQNTVGSTSETRPKNIFIAGFLKY